MFEAIQWILLMVGCRKPVSYIYYQYSLRQDNNNSDNNNDVTF